MEYPIMRGGAQYKIVTAQLNGGVNLSDTLHQVEDNQLTDCYNMWWHMGALRTRPGTVSEDAGIGDVIYKRFCIDEQEEVVVFQKSETTKEGCYRFYSVHAVNGISQLGEIIINRAGVSDCKMCVIKDGHQTHPYVIYANDGKIYRTCNVKLGDMTEIQPYIPLVFVEKFDATSGENKRIALESYNVLTPNFRCTMSSGRKDKKDPAATDDITYLLPATQNITNITVEVTLKDFETGKTRTVRASGPLVDSPSYTIGDSVNESEVFNDEWPWNGQEEFSGSLAFSKGWRENEIHIGVVGGPHYVLYSLPQVSGNNITVTVTCEQTSDFNRQYFSLLDNVSSAWFGGSNSGLGSGTRLLYASGAAVRWSEVNNALYFPENNYAYIGKANESITALAKQSDLLLVFKKNEIHALQYVAGNSITAEDVENGADISAMAATFPITPIHSTIGCDCPDTIRLVNNRLVWATSDAHVYMLPNVNPFSERNVRDITAMIRRYFEEYKGDTIKAAVGAEYKGHYMLALKNGVVFMLDVGNSAFQSYAYYSSEKKANRMLPWYIWEVPDTQIHVVRSINDSLVMLTKRKGESVLSATRFEGETDNGVAVSCGFKTKAYDFGQPEKLKRIGEMYVAVGSRAGNCIRLSYMTERETLEDVYRIEPIEDADTYDANYMVLYRVMPNINRTRVFGLQCDSNGVMAVEGIRLSYSVQGDVK